MKTIAVDFHKIALVSAGAAPKLKPVATVETLNL